MAKSVNDIRSSGTLRYIGSATAGPADDFQSAVTINSDGILSQTGNAGTVVRQTKGDGRNWTPLQGVTPANLTPGDYFIETYLGVEYFVYVDSGGVPQRLAPVSIVSADIPVPVGPAVDMDTFLVDDVRYATYDYTAYNDVTGEQEGGTISIGHDGSASSDATTVQLANVISVAFGTSDITFNTILTGVGVAQTWGFSATASSADWSVAYTRRMES
jgi:hypothetical protein